MNKIKVLNYNSCTEESSVKIVDEKNKTKNHKTHRSTILQGICKKCKLFDDFENGIRKLSHDELFGIAANLIGIEKGTKCFMEVRSKYTELYSDEKNIKWKNHLSYMVQNDYMPERCDKYCPYCEECIHGKNILTTVHPECGDMEPIAGYHEEFSSIEEMQEDIYNAVHRALFSDDKKYYIIKAQVGAGKSHTYLKLMEEYSQQRFIIAVPTNLLKREIYEKAKRLGIEVRVTPSLEEIKDEIPDSIWNRIQRLYEKGRYRLVHKYIQKELEKEDIPCLRKYMEKRGKIKKWKGCVITTHRYLLNMDKNKLDTFGSLIIDEDIIFKSVISNQEQITVGQLKHR